jgi:hypothetical protein
MDNASLLKYLLLLLLPGVTVGCVHQLPEHGKPRFIAYETDDLTSRKGFSYRLLEITDFQAKSLPADYRQDSHNIGALSCISIRPSKGAKINIVQSYFQDMLFYAGTISQLTFEAIFVPGCSWWNQGIVQSREEYVLQHEQIHFALSELAARKLTSEAGYEIKNYLAIGNTYGQIQEEIMEKLKSMVRETMEASLEDHTRFDEDTSMYYDPSVQQKWLEDVLARLGEQDSL